jgi:hypothetical protein
VRPSSTQIRGVATTGRALYGASGWFAGTLPEWPIPSLVVCRFTASAPTLSLTAPSAASTAKSSGRSSTPSALARLSGSYSGTRTGRGLARCCRRDRCRPERIQIWPPVGRCQEETATLRPRPARPLQARRIQPVQLQRLTPQSRPRPTTRPRILERGPPRRPEDTGALLRPWGARTHLPGPLSRRQHMRIREARLSAAT